MEIIKDEKFVRIFFEEIYMVPSQIYKKFNSVFLKGRNGIRESRIFQDYLLDSSLQPITSLK